MDKLLLTPPEAATMLGIGRTKLYDLLRTGALFSIRLGGSRRIPRAAVEAFVAGLVPTEGAAYGPVEAPDRSTTVVIPAG